MQSVSHAHRGYSNLRAYRSASDLCALLFWQSRSFRSSLFTSLTRPLRERSFRVFQAVLRVWKSRNDERMLDFQVDQALDEIWMLRQYVIRAQAEEVLPEGMFSDIEARLDELTTLVQRLQAGLKDPA